MSYERERSRGGFWFCFSQVRRLCVFLKIQDMRGWYLTDISGRIRVAPQQDDVDPPQQISVSSLEAHRALAQGYYWSAPAPYLGNKVSPYGAGFLLLCFSRSITRTGFDKYFFKESSEQIHDTVSCQMQLSRLTLDISPRSCGGSMYTKSNELQHPAYIVGVLC